MSQDNIQNNIATLRQKRLICFFQSMLFVNFCLCLLLIVLFLNKSKILGEAVVLLYNAGLFGILALISLLTSTLLRKKNQASTKILKIDSDSPDILRQMSKKLIKIYNTIAFMFLFYGAAWTFFLASQPRTWPYYNPFPYFFLSLIIALFLSIRLMLLLTLYHHWRRKIQ